MSIEGMLQRQAGVISRRQALAAGLSGSAISVRVAERSWRPLHPGVYLSASHSWTTEVSVWAAVLWAGTGATLSGLAAAWWHGLTTDRPGWIEVTVPRRRYPRPQPKVLIRRRDLDNADRTKRRGLVVTALPLTVLEAAVALGTQGGPLLDRALQRTVELEEVHRALCRNLGWHGSGAAARLLAAAADRAASHAERIMIRLLRGAHVTGWECGYRFGRYVLDFAFPAQRVAIEVDGWAWHWDVERFRRDRPRQNTIELAGWTVLRYTWHDLNHRPAEVIAEIRAAISGQAAV